MNNPFKRQKKQEIKLQGTLDEYLKNKGLKSDAKEYDATQAINTFLNKLQKDNPTEYEKVKGLVTVKTDTMEDPAMLRGKVEGMIGDSVLRLEAKRIIRPNLSYIRMTQACGFANNIASIPAEDMTREWITITTNIDDENGDDEIARMIQNRMTELEFPKKLKEMIRFSRIYPRGGFMYIGILSALPQADIELMQPINLDELEKIDFIHVIDDSDRVTVMIFNRYDPTKRDYLRPHFYVMGKPVDQSRLVWLVKDFYPPDLLGVSMMEICYDSISAQESALWSVSHLVRDMSTKILYSDEVAGMPLAKRIELTTILSHLMDTTSTILLRGQDKDKFEKMMYQPGTTIKDIFEFIFDNMAGVSEIPKNVLLGKAFGVVSAGEWDALNYYNSIKKEQELNIRPIIEKFIEMIVHEKRGEIYKLLGDKVNDIDWEFEFNPVYRLDEVAQTTRELTAAQRDALDIQWGKITAEEARQMDQRMDILVDFENKDITEEERKKRVQEYGKSHGLKDKNLPEDEEAAADFSGAGGSDLRAASAVKEKREFEPNPDKPDVEKWGIVKERIGKPTKKKDEADKPEVIVQPPTPINVNVNIDNTEKKSEVKKVFTFEHDEKGHIHMIKENQDDNPDNNK